MQQPIAAVAKAGNYEALRRSGDPTDAIKTLATVHRDPE
jgi:hypothetical protein